MKVEQSRQSACRGRTNLELLCAVQELIEKVLKSSPGASHSSVVANGDIFANGDSTYVLIVRTCLFMRSLNEALSNRSGRSTPDAKASLEAWYGVVRKANWKTPAEMKQV